MPLHQHKQQLFEELSKKFSTTETEVYQADSILLKTKNSITKIPMRHCIEEVYILRTFKKLGISTVDINEVFDLDTQIGKVSAYSMNNLCNVVDVINYKDKYLNNTYYNFLGYIFTSLNKIQIKGFGSIQLTDTGIKTQFRTDKELLCDVLSRTARRAYWPIKQITELQTDLDHLQEMTEGCLVHTDILNNILVNRDGTQFYLIDPQTIVSAANEYWDLSSYLVYANGFDCTNGLIEFIQKQSIKDWNRFLITTKINAYERTSFYQKYDTTKIHGMNAFVDALREDKILIGSAVLSKEDFIHPSKV